MSIAPGSSERAMDIDTSKTREIRLRLICLSPPPHLHEGEPTVSGLQDKR